MKNRKITWLLVLSVAGVLFSGYMSATKLFTQTCAFNESCPYFLGMPACYFGFGLFFSLFILSLLLFFEKIHYLIGINILNRVAAGGVIFAGYYAVQDVPVLMAGGLGAYVLGLPTCVWGLIFFLIIFILSEILIRKK